MIVKELANNEYRWRIITQPWQGRAHIAGDGFRIGCAEPGKISGTCPLCLQGNVPPRYWLLGVIDRTDNDQYAVFRIGTDQFSSLRSYALDPDYGDPSGYDVEIDKIDSFHGGLWSLHPRRLLTPLTDAEQVIKANVDKEFLIRSTSPWPVGCVETMMARHW